MPQIEIQISDGNLTVAKSSHKENCKFSCSADHAPTVPGLEHLLHLPKNSNHVVVVCMCMHMRMCLQLEKEGGHTKQGRQHMSTAVKMARMVKL
jgi:hypothetical protein